MASESTIADSEGSVFQVLEGVVYYVDPTTTLNAMNAFVGSKEFVDTASHQVKFKPLVRRSSLLRAPEERGIPVASRLMHHSLNQWAYVLRWTRTSL